MIVCSLASLWRGLDGHALDLQVVVQAVLALLASIARLFVATERRSHVEIVVAVDPNSAGTQAVGYLVGSVDVLGEDRCG